MSGAITALGDTLFPASTLAEGFLQDTSNSAHFLIELRIYHPLIAIVTILLILSMLKFGLKGNAEPQNKLSNLLVGLFLLQLFLGGLNVLLLAPIWMQIIHLLVADLIWICFVFFVNRVIYFDA
jgi:heme A synthase